VVLAAASAPGTAAAAAPEIEATLIVPVSVTAGTQAVIDVELALGSEWHVNSHTPTFDYLIPTEVRIAPSSGTVGAVRYPAPVERRFEFSDEPLSVYEGMVHFRAELEVPADARGEIAVEAVVSFQACNQHQCLAPRDVALSGVVRVDARTE